MKVKEFLEGKSNEKCFIGAESSWIWIGPADEMIKKLPKMDHYFQQMFADSVKRNHQKVEGLLSLIAKKKSTNLEKMRLLEEALRGQRTLVKYETALAEWINIEDRECEPEYNEIQEGWLIKIKGYETGTLWWEGKKKTPFDK